MAHIPHDSTLIHPDKVTVDVPGKPELTKLLQQLHIVRRKAGNPAFRQIAKSTDKLSLSTVSRIFKHGSGIPIQPPKWDNLQVILLVLGVSPEEMKQDWHPLWLTAMEEAKPITGARDTHAGYASHVDEVTGNVMPAGLRGGVVAICTVCGAWVGDRDKHDEYHRRVDAALEMLDRILTHRPALITVLRPGDSPNRPAMRVRTGPSPANVR